MTNWNEDPGLRGAPKDQYILVHRDGWGHARVGRWSSGNWWTNNERVKGDLDRWMPLPLPPTQGTEA